MARKSSQKAAGKQQEVPEAVPEEVPTEAVSSDAYSHPEKENDEAFALSEEETLPEALPEDDDDSIDWSPDEDEDDDESPFQSRIASLLTRTSRFNSSTPPAIYTSALHQFFPKLTTIAPTNSALVLVGPQHLKDYAYKRREGTASEASGSFIDYVRWLKRLDKEVAIIPHISGKDSAETHVFHSDLSHGNFHGCIIEGIHFKQVNFSYANFRDAVLHAVTFTDCDCKQIDFRGADIHDLVMDAESNSKASSLIIDITDIKKASLMRAVPSSLTFHDAIIDPNYASFRQDSEIDVDIMLIPCNPDDVKLYLKQQREGFIDHTTSFNQFIKEHKRIEESDTVVIMADLSNMNFPYHGITDLRHANFTESVLSGAILAGCALDHANFQHANLESCDLSNVTAHKTCFDDVSGRFMNARGAMMHEASFKYANLAYSDFSACQMDKARGDYANFSHSIWNPKDFTAMPEHYSSLANAHMPYSNFKYARATYMNIEGAQLRSAHFDGAHFDFTNGCNANFSGATMRHFITTNSIYTQANFSKALADYAQFRQDQAHSGEVLKHLEKANFSHAHLEMALFLRQNASQIDLSNSNADQMQIIDCHFPMADMHNASLRGVSFYQTPHNRSAEEKKGWFAALLSYLGKKPNPFTLEPSRFNAHKECDKINAIGANMDRSVFHHGSFKQCHFEFASLVECKFIHCDFSQTNFAHTHAKGSVWQHVLLRYSIFNYASLENTFFNHCDFSLMQANASNFSLARFYRSLLHKVNFDNCNFFKACFRLNCIEYIEGNLLHISRIVFHKNTIQDPVFLAAQQEFSTRYSLYGKWLLMCYSLAVGGGNICGSILGSGASIATVSGQFSQHSSYIHHAFLVSDLFVPIVIAITSLLCGYYAYRIHPEVRTSIRHFFRMPERNKHTDRHPFKTPPLHHAHAPGNLAEESSPLTNKDAEKILEGTKLFGDEGLSV